MLIISSSEIPGDKEGEKQGVKDNPGGSSGYVFKCTFTQSHINCVFGTMPDIEGFQLWSLEAKDIPEDLKKKKKMRQKFTLHQILGKYVLGQPVPGCFLTK